MVYQAQESPAERGHMARVLDLPHPHLSLFFLSFSPPPVPISSTVGGVPSVVIRNHAGDFIGACGECFHAVTNAELAEAMAIRSALTFAAEQGMDNIIVASDCLSVVQRIQSQGEDRSMCAPVVHDIKTMVASFQGCAVRHVSRLQNVAAHVLARSVELSSRSVWHGVPPECIRETICIDFMSQ